MGCRFCSVCTHQNPGPEIETFVLKRKNDEDDCIQSAISYPNGDKYEGQMKLGVPEGRGRLVKANGEIYEGSFINGTPSGESAAEEKVFLSNIRKGIIKKDENDGKKMDENDERGKKA